MVTGKLWELYGLALRHAEVEEHFLTLRTLLLHMYAVALNGYKTKLRRSLKANNQEGSRLADRGSTRSNDALSRGLDSCNARTVRFGNF